MITSNSVLIHDSRSGETLGEVPSEIRLNTAVLRLERLFPENGTTTAGCRFSAGVGYQLFEMSNFAMSSVKAFALGNVVWIN